MDGSRESEAVIPVLSSVIREQPLGLTLFQSAESRSRAGEARSSLDRLLESTKRRGIRPVAKVGWGPPAREILSFARAGNFDWVAMTTHGRTGLRRALMGSVAEEVIRGSRCPLLIARSGIRVKDWDRIVVALDGSRAAEEILPDAVSISKAVEAQLYILTVEPRPWQGRSITRQPRVVSSYLSRLEAELKGSGVEVHPVFRRGRPAAAILRFAREIDAGLLCLTTHGRTGMKRALMGSVAEAVIRRSGCPVLVRRSARAARSRKKAT